jgi:long-chain acyl-CoA synthetase
VTTLAGLLRLGAIAVPMGTRLQTPEIAYILAHCGAVGLVHDEDLTARLPDAADVPALRHRWVDPPREAARAARDLLPPRPPVTEEDTVFILYTLGTTGRPKGAMLTHLNVVHSVLHFRETMSLAPGERSLLAVPASHVTGLVAIILAMWAAGGCTVLMPEFKAAAFVALAERERITHTVMVPAMYNLCLMQPGFATADLSAWRIGGYGGAPMPVATIDALAARLPQLTLVNAYGATETTSPTTMIPMGQTRGHADTVGVPLPAARVTVMDDDGHEVPVGTTGELWIAGPMVVPGYWANPEATAIVVHRRLVAFGRPGLGRRRGLCARVRPQEGHAQPRRLQDLFGRGRERADGLARHGGGAIVGQPCPVLGERVHAFVHVAAGSAAAGDSAALQAHCAARLADYKVPERITWCADPLPRNANGKLMKRLLREQLQGASGT